MTNHSRIATLATVLFAGMSMGGIVQAGPMVEFGRPVEGISDFDAAVPDYPAKEGNAWHNTVTGQTQYYIPLSQNNAGVFGVTSVGRGKTAGTRSDSGSGSSQSTLTMYLHFDVPSYDSIDTAQLAFHFEDLDLAGANDPNGFYEAVRLYDRGGNALTQKVTDITDTALTSAVYDWTLSGDDDSQHLVFNNVRSLITGADLVVQLDFFSSSSRWASNTPEQITAVLTTTENSSVPEPATMALMGLGALLMFRRKRNQ